VSEGGEIFPLFALQALRVELNGSTVSFLSPENLASYGLLSDPTSDSNPYGLPVGLTVAPALDTGLLSVGFNCAACHVGELTYDAQGTSTTMRIDGAPSHFSPDAYLGAIAAGFDASLGANAGLATKAAFGARALVDAAQVESPNEDYDGTAVAAMSRFQMLMQVIQAAKTGQGDINQIVGGFDVPDTRKQFFLARYYSLKTPTDPQETAMLSGRTDPFAIGSDYLFAGFNFYSTPQSPMRFQPLFEMQGKSWYDYTGNTNSIEQRNIIQAMAVGGLTEMVGTNPSLSTSVNFQNLSGLEQAVYQIQTPSWPDALPYDANLAARGQVVYQQYCSNCHEPTLHDSGLYDVKVIPLADIGTDPNAIRQYLTPITTPFATGDLGVQGNAVIPLLEQNYCSQSMLSAAACLQLDETYDATNNPQGVRGAPQFTTDAPGYQADILDGAWAYGTYLHNGSVPSMADLLQPSSNRPTTFAVGHKVYDPVRMGYTFYASLTADAVAAGATGVIDTTLPGNSNAGHEGDAYGTNLSSDDKTALIEYLKKHVSIVRAPGGGFQTDAGAPNASGDGGGDDAATNSASGDDGGASEASSGGDDSGGDASDNDAGDGS
jgi:hypothetical protein